jgi:hypothetical protein
MTQKPAPLSETITIAKWFKSRRRDIVVVVEVGPHEGVNIVNVREHFIGRDGCMRPTTRGIAMSVRRLPEFSRAVRRALETARERNLLPEEGGDE